MLVRSLSSSVTDGDIMEIEHANYRSLKEQCFQGLIFWRNTDCQEKTALEILKALRKGLAEFRWNKVAGTLHQRRVALYSTVTRVM